MFHPFQAIPIADDVYWVGAIDWSLREFHGYETPRGSTYNAFLVLGERVALVDTVKAPFMDEMMSRIASVIDPARIDVVVSNHAEMDHSGCLVDVVERVKPQRVLASAKGVEALKAHFHPSFEIEAVAEGGSLELSGANAPGGPLSLRFYETRFLHWPDSMFSYLPERRLLFSNDGFGMHLASSERFDDQLPRWLLEREAAKYFANILMPLTVPISKTLEKVATLGLDIAMIAPDHGPVWRKDPAWILERYAAWAAQKPSSKALVLYGTMWKSTELMARVIAEGVAAAGATAKLLPMEGTHRSELATEALDAGALIVGSPTMNGQIYPALADGLTYLKGLKPKGRIGATFGSYGWSPDSLKHLDQTLKDMGVESLGSVKVQYVPTEEILAQCRELGLKVGARLVELGG